MVFDKYAMKDSFPNKTQITHFSISSKSDDFDHVCHVIMYREILIVV